MICRDQWRKTAFITSLSSCISSPLYRRIVLWSSRSHANLKLGDIDCLMIVKKHHTIECWLFTCGKALAVLRMCFFFSVHSRGAANRISDILPTFCYFALFIFVIFSSHITASTIQVLHCVELIAERRLNTKAVQIYSMTSRTSVILKTDVTYDITIGTHRNTTLLS